MSLRNQFIWITVFAIAMGFLESAVVVYMREIHYPEGFKFPLTPIPADLAVTELFRELATLIMLVSIGVMAGRRFSTGFAWFIYTFATWDIFYYVFLWLLLGWPENLLTWDILFLIPTIWTGPVIAPVLLSLTMILLAVLIVVYEKRGRQTRILPAEWGGLVLGSLVLIFGFILDYSQHMMTHFTLTGMLDVKNPEVMEVATRYMPFRFPWWIFAFGEIILLFVISLYARRLNRQTIRGIDAGQPQHDD
ncbi:MAG: hypothetical protein EHM46_02335 [Bacteroidetes bacterium]|nr:MAG: hypothetical protein EHM46_02335 [Bacteroidota bacterium]